MKLSFPTDLMLWFKEVVSSAGFEGCTEEERERSRGCSLGIAASDSMDGEIWLNKGSIEGRVPSSAMNKHQNKQSKSKATRSAGVRENQ